MIAAATPTVATATSTVAAAKWMVATAKWRVTTAAPTEAIAICLHQTSFGDRTK
jgi:hypothetical protein